MGRASPKITNADPCRCRASWSIASLPTARAETGRSSCSSPHEGQCSELRPSSVSLPGATIGLKGLHPHELRHTAASLAVSSGANVKAVQHMLGHARASMTLDVYADLFPDDLDSVAEALDEARRNSLADFSLTSEVPTPMHPGA